MALCFLNIYPLDPTKSLLTHRPVPNPRAAKQPGGKGSAWSANGDANFFYLESLSLQEVADKNKIKRTTKKKEA
jgi:hypothetical protein